MDGIAPFFAASNPANTASLDPRFTLDPTAVFSVISFNQNTAEHPPSNAFNNDSNPAGLNLDARLCSLEAQVPPKLYEHCLARVKAEEEKHARSLQKLRKQRSKPSSSGSSESLPEPIARVDAALRGLNLPESSYSFVEAPEDYYDRTLEERCQIVGAASVDHLCKSLIYKNAKWTGEGSAGSEFLCVIVQYSHEIDEDKMLTALRNTRQPALPLSAFDLRFATPEETGELTGFEFNAVAPVGMLKGCPVIVTKEVTRLVPPEIFLGKLAFGLVHEENASLFDEDVELIRSIGGGLVHTKLRLGNVNQFVAHAGAVVMDISKPRSH